MAIKAQQIPAKLTFFDLLEKEILLPKPHIIKQLNLLNQFDNVQNETQYNQELTKILQHKRSCFRRYVIIGEVLPIILILKEKKIGLLKEFFKENQSESNKSAYQNLIKNLAIKTAFLSYTQRDKQLIQKINPSFSHFIDNSTYIESKNHKKEDLEQQYIFQGKEKFIQYAVNEETGTIFFLILQPALLSNTVNNMDIMLTLYLTYSVSDKQEEIQKLFLQSDDVLLKYLIKDKDAFVLPYSFNSEINKVVVPLQAFSVSYNNDQANTKNLIKIKLKYNADIIELTDKPVNDDQFLVMPSCKMSQKELYEELALTFYHLEFLIEQSTYQYIHEDLKIQDKFNIKDMFAIQAYTEQNEIKLMPYSEKSIIIILEQKFDRLSEQLANSWVKLKCHYCRMFEEKRHRSQMTKYDKDKKLRHQTSLRYQSQDQIIDEKGRANNPSSSTFFQDSANENIKDSKKETDRKSADEWDDEEDAFNQSNCRCVQVKNQNLNITINTPFIARWRTDACINNKFSMFQVNWTHQGLNVLEVSLKTRKEEQFKIDSQIYIVMNVKNNTAKTMRLKCICQERILSNIQQFQSSKFGEKLDQDKAMSNLINQSYIVALSIHKYIDIGTINSGEVKVAKLEYYILNRGVFFLNKLQFIDEITQDKILVQIQFMKTVEL